MAEQKQRRDAAVTSEQILDAAEKLFAEHGFAHVSVREIAQQAEVTKSLIHHHFGAKDALWLAVKERAFSSYMNAQIDALTSAANEQDGPKEGLLRNSIEMYFRYLEANPRLVRIMSWAQIEGDTNPVGARLMPLGAARIREAQAAGGFRSDLNPELTLAVFIAATTYWFQAQELFKTTMEQSCDAFPKTGPERNQLFIDNFLNIFFNGLLTDDARQAMTKEQHDA
jgi:TetR/AcrR family transcriptional regulator